MLVAAVKLPAVSCPLPFKDGFLNNPPVLRPRSTICVIPNLHIIMGFFTGQVTLSTTVLFVSASNFKSSFTD